MSDDVEMNTRGLDGLLKALKEKMPVARVGIFGGKTNRASGVGHNNNAEIGAKHEFGMDGMPVRSFLRVPIAEHMQKYLDDSGAFDNDTLKKVIQTHSLVEWVKKIGIIGEAIVSDAFDSGGFGKWKPSNMAYKKNHQTLVETQQLRNSITSEVRE